MTKQFDLTSLCLQEMERAVAGIGEKPYRAKQILKWVCRKRVPGIEYMTDLSKPLRSRLRETAFVYHAAPEKIAVSKDGSKKFLFRTEDGYGVESVLIPEKNHVTICISTQIGCAMKCRFCYTGTGGLVRNLSVSEILNQVYAVLRTMDMGDGGLPNIVFMGMGEPLANYDNTVKSIQILLAPWGANFSHRKVTVSTCGLPPQMQKLSDDLPLNLAISLNAPNDKIRNLLMPVNRKFPIKDLLQAAKQFPLPSRKRITFEYILIKDVNDSPDNARELGRLLQKIPCKINLIPFNEHPAVTFKQSPERSIRAFQTVLHELNFTAPIRRSKGTDIAAACGQLGDNKKSHSHT